MHQPQPPPLRQAPESRLGKRALERLKSDDLNLERPDEKSRNSIMDIGLTTCMQQYRNTASGIVGRNRLPL